MREFKIGDYLFDANHVIADIGEKGVIILLIGKGDAYYFYSYEEILEEEERLGGPLSLQRLWLI